MITTNEMKVEYLELSVVRVDEENIRRSYPEESLAELAKSIKRWGVRQPLEVREDEDSAGYIVVSGNRRFLAAKRAGLERVPCKVLSPEEAENAKELQIIENLQREGLDPVDEAEGYAWLLEHRPGLTMEDVAERIGKSKMYVSRRLKLRHAPQNLLAALREGRVSVRHAELVGSIPDVQAREQAAYRVLNPLLAAEPLTTKETELMIREEFVVSLIGAPFDLGKAVGKLGACVECPNRSGNAPELLAELGGGRKGGASPDLCLAPMCYRKKCGDVWAVVQRQAEAAGQTVWGADVAQAFWESAEGRVSGVRYADVEDRPGPELVGHFAERRVPTWGELIAGVPVPTIVAQHPQTLRPHTIIEVEAAMDAIEEAARENGQESPFVARADGRKEARKEAAKRSKEEKAEAFRERVGCLAILLQRLEQDQVMAHDALARLVLAQDEEALRWIAEVAGADWSTAEEDPVPHQVVRLIGRSFALSLWAVATDPGFRREGASSAIVQALDGDRD